MFGQALLHSSKVFVAGYLFPSGGYHKGLFPTRLRLGSYRLEKVLGLFKGARYGAAKGANFLLYPDKGFTVILSGGQVTSRPCGRLAGCDYFANLADSFLHVLVSLMRVLMGPAILEPAPHSGGQRDHCEQAENYLPAKACQRGGKEGSETKDHSKCGGANINHQPSIGRLASFYGGEG